MDGKLIILDYSTSKVHVYTTKMDLQSEEYEEIISELGYKHSEVNWMVSKEININIH